MIDLASAAERFRPAGVHLDTASVGLGPVSAADVLRAHLADWTAGQVAPATFDDVVDRARAAFATLVGTTADRVAILPAASPGVALLARGLPPGTRVLVAEEDFTSVLFPLLAAGQDGLVDVVVVPLAELIDRIDDDLGAVAVSAVQSADGRRLDLDRLADAADRHGLFTLVDLTQAAGWVPIEADRFDLTVTGAYKWLCCPRGSGFLTASDRAIESCPPLWANWYAGADRWSSIYRPPLRLAAGARRFDISPGWPVWPAAVESLELLGSVGVGPIHDHGVALANRFRNWFDRPAGDSAIVSLEADAAALDRLRRAGVAHAGRDGRLRLSFHLYNTADDVDVAARALQ